MGYHCTLSGLVRWSFRQKRFDVSKVSHYKINPRTFKIIDKEYNYDLAIVFHNERLPLLLRYETLKDVEKDVRHIKQIQDINKMHNGQMTSTQFDIQQKTKKYWTDVMPEK